MIEILSEHISIEQINSRPLLKQKLILCNRFSAIVLGKNIANIENSENTTINSFISYIFEEGTKEEKRELIDYLEKTLFIKDKRIAINP